MDTCLTNISIYIDFKRYFLPKAVMLTPRKGRGRNGVSLVRWKYDGVGKNHWQIVRLQVLGSEHGPVAHGLTVQKDTILRRDGQFRVVNCGSIVPLWRGRSCCRRWQCIEKLHHLQSFFVFSLLDLSTSSPCMMHHLQAKMTISRTCQVGV